MGDTVKSLITHVTKDNEERREENGEEQYSNKR